MAAEPTKSVDLETEIQGISDWILEYGLENSDLQELLEGVAVRLNEIGFSIKRGNFSLPILHPMIRNKTFTWFRDQQTEANFFSHEEADGEQWQQSPLKHMLDVGAQEFLFELEKPGLWEQIAMLVRLKQEGYSAYFAQATGFVEFEVAVQKGDGILTSWATDAVGGFTDAQLGALRRLQKRIALAAKVSVREETAHNILTAYLGGDAAKRVLDGQIRRGDGDVIPCVIWYSDLRHSTQLADELPGEEFLNLLNQYFECTAGAVLKGGGDVLRFIGDAVLAIFPIEDNRFDNRSACEAALKCAKAAQEAALVINKERQKVGKNQIEFGLGLHLGEVLFGNIGTPERVEFSVIGPAANEVCRLEGLTKELGKTVLLTSEFVEGAEENFDHLGDFDLRGRARTMGVYDGSIYRNS